MLKIKNRWIVTFWRYLASSLSSVKSCLLPLTTVNSHSTGTCETWIIYTSVRLIFQNDFMPSANWKNKRKHVKTNKNIMVFLGFSFVFFCFSYWPKALLQLVELTLKLGWILLNRQLGVAKTREKPDGFLLFSHVFFCFSIWRLRIKSIWQIHRTHVK